MTRLREVADVAEIDEINTAFDVEADRIKALCEVYWRPPGDDAFANTDPFTPEYRALVRSRLAEITQRAEYDPARSEKSPYLAEQKDGPAVPNDYTSGNSAWLGEMVQAYGGVLKALAMKSTHSIIEYGAGDGQIGLHLARMKCDVTVVDIEGAYLARIRSQAAALQVQIQTIEGLFGAAEPGRRYDRILFYEAFHHAIDHHELVPRLRELLAPGGAVVLAGEPVMARSDHFRPTLPYAWGPRLDGLSLRAMRAYGWCELGFAREYIIELFMRAGFLLTYHKDAATDRASAYIATQRPDKINLAGPCLLEAWGMPDCWHPGEGNIRWSREPVAAIPIDGGGTWQAVTLEIANPLPVEKTLDIECGKACESVQLAPGESRKITFAAAEVGSRIIMHAPVHRPCDLDPRSTDVRTLGIAISELRYT